MGWILHDQFGILNHLLLGIGLISAPPAWTAESRSGPDGGDPGRAEDHPFMALLILAALQMLPTGLP